MAWYTGPVKSVSISARKDTEGAEVIAQCNELASLMKKKPSAAVKEFLREVLPQRIAELRKTVKT
jgi:hypothetical protein